MRSLLVVNEQFSDKRNAEGGHYGQTIKLPRFFDEWYDIMIRKGITQAEALKRTAIVNDALPDALVENYEFLIPALTLPDEKDNHVLAAAIKRNANLIVTNNLKLLRNIR